MNRTLPALLWTLLCADAALAQRMDAAPTVSDAASSARPAVAQPIRIRITGGSTVLTAVLDATPPAVDFASLLPLTLPLEDYAAKEKIAYLPRRLTTAGVPAGADPAVADVAYYAPWGNLVLYYRDAPYASGVVRLGRLESDVALLEGLRAARVTIERIQP